MVNKKNIDKNKFDQASISEIEVLRIGNIIESYQKAAAKKMLWQPIFDECYNYFLPRTERINPLNQKPLYDSTGVISLESFASNLKHSLLPPWRKWFEININDQIKSKDDTKLSQIIEERISKPLFNAINVSNFDVEISQSLLELGIGTGAILINEGKSANQPLVFTSVSINDLVLEEGPYGKIENVYRQHSLTSEKIFKLWPDANFSKENNNDKESEHTILEATIYDHQKDRYELYLIDIAQSRIILKDEYQISPWVIFRWSKIAGETYGRGPAIQCLPDIKEANKLKELMLQNAVLSVIPTYLVSNDGVINPHSVKIKPGGVIPVRSLQNGAPIAPLPRGTDINTGHILLEQAREIVRQTMYYGRIQPTGANKLSTGYKQTATEIIIRSQQLAKDIGASFGRLQTELLERIIMRSLYILDKKGITRPIKEINENITLRFTSPLSRIQDQEEINALERILPLASNLPEEFRLSIKTEKIPPWLAAKSGISPTLLRSEEEKDAISNIITTSKKQQSANALNGANNFTANQNSVTSINPSSGQKLINDELALINEQSVNDLALNFVESTNNRNNQNLTRDKLKEEKRNYLNSI